jgi:hypothetical protein
MSLAQESKNIGVYDVGSINLDKAKTERSSTYSWKEPKEGLVATLFPSESTWHTLYNHNILEYATTMYNIDNIYDTMEKEKTLSAEEIKKQRKNAQNHVKEVIRESYIVKSQSRLIWSSVIAIIVIGIITFIYYHNTGVISGFFYIGMVAFCIIIPLYYLVNMYVFAPGDGDIAIDEYTRALDAYQGLTGPALLDRIRSDYNDQKNREVMSTFNRATPSNTSNIGLLGLAGLLR